MELNIFIFTLFLSALFIFALADNNVERKAYIIYMGNALESKSLAVEHHHNLLLEVTQDGEVARRSRIHSYGKSFNAFAAYLLPDEAQRLQENEKVVSVFPSKVRELQTTNSWDFTGMPLSVERNSQNESDIIIGVLDTGIDIDSPSFNDKGFGPPPSKWKGSCQVGTEFSGCNNKVIGARVYNLVNASSDPNPSVVDYHGHGTHTASTAAGVAVPNASFFGLAEGTARGGVPSARIAVYKVCHSAQCEDTDILAALDDAIDDGVDILSLSLGATTDSIFNDVVAIGSFHAMKKGILSSAAAGNFGPQSLTLANGAPWIFTVGATFTDRQFNTPIIIGNRTDIMGINSLNTFNLTDMYLFIKGSIRYADDSNDTELKSAGRVVTEDDIKGKILFVKGFGGAVDALKVKNSGGVGLIFHCRGGLLSGTPSYVIPCACVDPLIGEDIYNYINSTNNPVASIHQSVAIQNTSAPFMASFSSRGPDNIALSIIKPDVVAPGVDILAASSKYSSRRQLDDRVSEYVFLSGTSMACPHVSGAAAYVKSFHPDWSPSAIKSALMTTASEIKVKDKFGEFAYGAGHINPTKALHPGLVYELETKDYVRFLCNEGYNGTELEKIVGEGVNCSSIPKFGGLDDLNYPSMLVMQKDPNANIAAVFNRTVKNVGDAGSTYKANVTLASGDVQIKVTPDTLTFKQVNEVTSFTVEVKGPPLKNLNDNLISLSLIWTDSVHNVRSPILIFPEYKLEKDYTIGIGS